MALVEKPMTTDWTKQAERIALAIAGHAGKHDAEDSFVTEGFAALEEAGFFTALVPADFGGGGATIGEIAEALSQLLEQLQRSAHDSARGNAVRAS